MSEEELKVESGIPGLPKVKVQGHHSIRDFAYIGSLLSIVGMFLFYNERMNIHDDQLGQLRIETCHQVSDRSTEAAHKMAEAAITQSIALTELSIAVEEIDEKWDELLRHIRSERR